MPSLLSGAQAFSRWGRALLALTLLTGGCALAARPGAMSLEEHRRAAQHADALALEHEGLFRPDARPRGTLWRRSLDDLTEDNPSARHLRHAALLRRRAELHRRAAAAAANELEPVEDQDLPGGPGGP